MCTQAALEMHETHNLPTGSACRRMRHVGAAGEGRRGITCVTLTFRSDDTHGCVGRGRVLADSFETVSLCLCVRSCGKGSRKSDH